MSQDCNRMCLLIGSNDIQQRLRQKKNCTPVHASLSLHNQVEFYTDISLEFDRAREDLNWNHDTATPYCSETNGIAERAAPRVNERTTSVLVLPGLLRRFLERRNGMP